MFRGKLVEFVFRYMRLNITLGSWREAENNGVTSQVDFRNRHQHLAENNGVTSQVVLSINTSILRNYKDVNGE